MDIETAFCWFNAFMITVVIPISFGILIERLWKGIKKC